MVMMSEREHVEFVKWLRVPNIGVSLGEKTACSACMHAVLGLGWRGTKDEETKSQHQPACVCIK